MPAHYRQRPVGAELAARVTAMHERKWPQMLPPQGSAHVTQRRGQPPARANRLTRPQKLSERKPCGRPRSSESKCASSD